MFYQGTGTRWLKTVMAELYAEGGSGAATTYEQLFEAIQARRALSGGPPRGDESRTERR